MCQGKVFSRSIPMTCILKGCCCCITVSRIFVDSGNVHRFDLKMFLIADSFENMVKRDFRGHGSHDNGSPVLKNVLNIGETIITGYFYECQHCDEPMKILLAGRVCIASQGRIGDLDFANAGVYRACHRSSCAWKPWQLD